MTTIKNPYLIPLLDQIVYVLALSQDVDRGNKDKLRELLKELIEHEKKP